MENEYASPGYPSRPVKSEVLMYINTYKWPIAAIFMFFFRKKSHAYHVKL